jgi:hypothetical protein
MSFLKQAGALLLYAAMLLCGVTLIYILFAGARSVYHESRIFFLAFCVSLVYAVIWWRIESTTPKA